MTPPVGGWEGSLYGLVSARSVIANIVADCPSVAALDPDADISPSPDPCGIFPRGDRSQPPGGCSATSKPAGEASTLGAVFGWVNGDVAGLSAVLVVGMAACGSGDTPTTRAGSRRSRRHPP